MHDEPTRSEVDDQRSAAEPQPDAKSVYDYLLFGVSLPERALRATSAMVGGALKESASLIVPQAFRSSKSYSLFVQQMLDFMANDVGGVARGEAEGQSTTDVEGYVARKTVSTFVDLAGLATMHISPMTVLALLSDIAYGSKEYLQELSEELKRQGVIAPDSTIDSAAALLDAVRDTAGASAEAFDLPPVSVDGLQQTIEQTREKVATIDPTQLLPERELRRMWEQIYEVAAEEKVSPMEVAGALSLFTLNRIGSVGVGALSTVQVAGNLFDRHFLEHYRDGLSSISERGFYATLSEASTPYITAVWDNFSTDRTTLTEDLFSGRLVGQMWDGMQSWFAARPDTDVGSASCQTGESADSGEGGNESVDTAGDDLA